MAGIKPEFSRPLSREEILRGDEERRVEADPGERERLAERFDLLALDKLAAEIVVRQRGRKPLVRVEGRLEAEATQACVVTLEPVASRISERFIRLYSLEPLPDTDGREVLIAAEGDEPPELIGPEGLDLGEIAAEELGLALDPYPRAPGAELPEEFKDGEGPEEASESPFAVLEKWKGEH